MAAIYRNGDAVPRDGLVRCTQWYSRQVRVTAGTRFGQCSRWNSNHHGLKCTWQYLDELAEEPPNRRPWKRGSWNRSAT